MLVKIALLVAVFAAAANGEIEKRRAACPKKYQKLSGHSACIAPSPKAQDPGVSAEDAKLIVKEHMRVRGEVNPPAADMRELTWDDELAMTAQAWAEACTQAHDTNDQRVSLGRFGVGQNLAMNSPRKDWNIAIKGWEDEKDDFTYGKPTGAMIGHYTQMVWASTTSIGCGYAKCGATNYYVCNYGPAGNNMQTRFSPWKSGKSCGDCPGKCKNNICDCGGKTCLNNADTDLKTCSCKCTVGVQSEPLPFYKAPLCKLDCNGAEEPAYCGGSFGADKCNFSNVKAACPKMCGLCD